MKNDYEIRDDKVAIFLKRRTGELIETVIDLEDLELMHAFKGRWFSFYNKTAKGFYVRGAFPKEPGQKGREKYILLHRYLMGDPPGFLIDHMDRNPLNNKRENLRRATASQNQQNRRLNALNTSGVRGVTWNKEKKKWKARVVVKGKEVFTRYFNDLDEASEAVEHARKEFMTHYLEEV